MNNPQPQHTIRQYEEELRSLRTELLKMGGLVERQIADAVDSLVSRNSDKAREVIARDAEVNRMDIEIDAMCIRTLALRAPAASDLRFITTGLKINYDLERIGDMAVNICERALELNEEPILKPYIDIPRIATIVESMVRDSLDAFLRGDCDLARQVIDRDDEVDQLNHQIFRELLSYMAEDRIRSAAAPGSCSSPSTSSESPTTPPISARWWCSWSRARLSATWTRARSDERGSECGAHRAAHHRDGGRGRRRHPRALAL